MRLAEETDQCSQPEAMDIPEELNRCKARLAAIARAKEEIQAPAQERLEREQAEFEAKQAYNAQAGVDVETHLIVEQHLTQHPNDKQEIEPALEAIGQLPEALGEAKKLLADTGYFSESNVEKCTKAHLVPFIPEKRDKHHCPLMERLGEDPEPPRNATAVQAMKHRLQTQEGKAAYAKRKSTVETVFGIIKQVQGFRQRLLRGLDSVQNEWSLLCIGWNLKRMHALRG